MDRQSQAAGAPGRPVNDQQLVDEVERESIAAYVATSTFLRALLSTVEEATRRADALHRLDLALRTVPVV